MNAIISNPDKKHSIIISCVNGEGHISGQGRETVLLYHFSGHGCFEYGLEGISLREDEACIFQAEGEWRYRYKEGEVAAIYIGNEFLMRKTLPLFSDCPVILNFIINSYWHPEKTSYLHFYHGEKAAETQELIRRMSYEYEREQSILAAALQTELIALMARLSWAYWVKTKAQSIKAGPFLGELMVYLNEHMETATLESTAAHFNYHPNTISSMCKRELGKTFSSLQKELRLKRAHDLLYETDLPVATVAELCGYTHLTSFYKAFKSYYGTTPRQI